MKRSASLLLWLAIALLGAFAYITIAFQRGEPINSAYILTAALCTYAIGYRFYAKWIAARILTLDDRRATPCEVHEDGKDYVKTNKWIVFGHHFAAISGPGPLVGPVLAAQFGYLPGTLWILIGVVLGGAVQDFIILAASMRRDGKSLAQMVRDELNGVAGVIGVAAILSIMIVLLAVLALVVVNVLAESAWGVFTVGATIPIALLMGGYLRFVRVGKVLEVSLIGVVLLLAAVWGGQFVHSDPGWSAALRLEKETLAWALIAYGLAASILPVWMLLAPRDYLSTFMKLGTIFALALGVLLVLPDLRMPAVSTFIDGSGLIIPGKLFPFCFITIACGAISGFHTLIASGITPKIIARETHARPVGYGAMCLESLVAIMALIAACTLEPDVYLAMNTGGTPESITQRVNASGFTAFSERPGENAAYAIAPVTVNGARMEKLAEEVGESTLYGRAGGAATLAVGMASIFGNLTRGRYLDLWYHFAIMFEALFILTTIDAGTRVGRYLLQDALGHLWKPMGNLRSLRAGIAASVIVVLLWGGLLVQSVRDPLGGIKSLWPIFGIANQLLAAIALCLVTTILLKTGLRRGVRPRPGIALVSFIPLLWLMTVCLTAGLQLIFHKEERRDFPKIGFLQKARDLEDGLPPLEMAATSARTAELRARAEKVLRDQKTQIFNFRLDAVVAGIFITLAVAIFLIALAEWWKILGRRSAPVLSETEPVWLPDAVARGAGSPVAFASAVTLGFALLKEVSGEADLDRAQAVAEQCDCAEAQTPRGRQNTFLTVTGERYQSVRRCC